MPEQLKYCPDCGAPLNGNTVCDQCGFNTQAQANTAPQPQTYQANSPQGNYPQQQGNYAPNPQSQRSANWPNMEHYVSLIGKWAWILPVISAIVNIIFAIIAIGLLSTYSNFMSQYVSGPIYDSYQASYNQAIGTVVWDIIQAALVLVFALIWILPKFSKKCGNKEWQALVDNSLKLGSIQIPWMLIIGILVEIFGGYWGGLMILVPAILIIMFAPVNFSFKVSH